MRHSHRTHLCVQEELNEGIVVIGRGLTLSAAQQHLWHVDVHSETCQLAGIDSIRGWRAWQASTALLSSSPWP